MTDAVKMAIDALTDIRTSIECAAGCDEGIDPMAAVSEIMSAYGTAMASAYSRAADMVNILAALEQAGEPVADDWGTPPDPDGHMSKNAVVEALDMMVEHWVQGTRPTDEQGRQATAALMSLNREPPLPTLQRLGQEFDAGEGLARRVAETMDEDGGCWSACSGCQEGVDGCVSTRDYPYSPIFKCQPGSGCRECGGIGVTWMDGAFLAGYDEALSVQSQSRVAAEPVGLREALKTIDHDAPANEPIDAPTVGFPPSRDPEEYDGNDIVEEAFREGVSRGLWEAAKIARHALATPSQPDPQSRGQAFDGEGEGDLARYLPLKFDPRDAKRWWEENMESKFVSARLAGDGYVKFHWRDVDESGDYSVPWTRIALWLAALSSAKRGEHEG
jgi:hypothetical protein